MLLRQMVSSPCAASGRRHVSASSRRCVHQLQRAGSPSQRSAQPASRLASCTVAAGPCLRWRVSQSRNGSCKAVRAAADEQLADEQEAEGAVLAVWDDGWGGPLEAEEDPAAEIWIDYEVPAHCFARGYQRVALNVLLVCDSPRSASL